MTQQLMQGFDVPSSRIQPARGVTTTPNSIFNMAPKGKNTPKSKGASATNAAPPLPSWPALKPLLPTSDLSISAVVDNQILVVKNFWTATLCKNFVSFLKTLPLTTTPGKPKRGDA